jgi:hypothetical protein
LSHVAFQQHLLAPRPSQLLAHRPRQLEHDPEKWAPVFGKDHVPTIT